MQAYDGLDGELMASGPPGVRSGGGDGDSQVTQTPTSPVVPGAPNAQPIRQSSSLRHSPKQLIEKI